MTFNFYDIIEQFDIFEFIELVKADPFYVVENLIISAILFFIVY
jgi:hypothetical protein